MTSVISGAYHTCALLSGGTVVCWGSSHEGLLGDGNNAVNAQAAPGAVQAVGGGGPLAGVTAITGGGAHTCALREGGTVACWGRGMNGQLGDGAQVAQATPVLVRGIDGSVLTGVRAIEADQITTRALLTNGTGACWGGCYFGPNDWGWTPLARPAAFPVREVIASAPVEERTRTAAVVSASLSVGPTPTSTRATATLTLPAGGHARLAVYDALGREVAVVFDGEMKPGEATFALPVDELASGVYIVRAIAGRTKLTQALVIAR